MIRVSLVRMADARAQGMVAELLCVSGSRLLRAERPRYMLASSKFKHVVFDRCAFRAALGTGLNVYIRHIGSSPIRFR